MTPDQRRGYRPGAAARRAHAAVAYAKKRGVLVPQSCEYCGAEPAVAHHDDYSRPLDVRWLCQSHHVRLHVFGGLREEERVRPSVAEDAA